MEFDEMLQDLLRQATAPIHAYRGLLRKRRPYAIAKAADERVKALAASNEAFRRAGRHHHAQVTVEIRRELEDELDSAGRLVRAKAHGGRSHIAAGRDAMAQRRRDVSVSMPDALKHIDPTGWLVLQLLDLQLEARLAERQDPMWLAGIYDEAYTRKDARAYLEMRHIERMVAAGLQLTDDTQLEAAKQLRLFVSDIQDARLPATPSLADFDRAERTLDTLDSRANLLGIGTPLATDNEAALDALLPELEAIGAVSDADDYAATRLRQQAEASA